MKKNCICKFKHRIEHQTNSPATDSLGGRTASFSTANTLWAAIKPISSFEKYQASALNVHTSHKIMLKHSTESAAITTADRLKLGSRYFNIQGIINIDEANRVLELTVLETNESQY